MAKVGYWTGQVVDLLNPGDVRSYYAYGFFSFGDAVSISAHPVWGADRSEVFLSVDNVRMEQNESGVRVFFDVRNSGSEYVDAFAVGFAAVSE